MTESCDADLPHLITNVETTPATTSDDAVTPPIHAALQARDLLPRVHFADTGFIAAELLVESAQRYQVDLFGPVRANYRRQGREGQGFAGQDFAIDWEVRRATCPAGRPSRSWTPATDKRGNPVIQIKFSIRDCQPCVHHAQCCDGARRLITVRPRAQYSVVLIPPPEHIAAHRY